MTHATPPSRPARIVFLLQRALSPYDAARFSLVAMAGRAEITVIDASPLVLPQVASSRAHYDTLAPVRCLVARSMGDLRQLSAVVAEADLVVNLVGSGNVTLRALPVLRWLSAIPTPTLIFSAGAIPAWAIPKQSWGLWQRLRRADLGASLLSRLPLEALGVRPADYVLYSGSASVVPRRLVTATTRPVWSTSPDYGLYLAALNGGEAPLVDRPYAVFIDQNLGFHTDIAAMGGAQPVDAAVFYPQLCRLFDAIEAQLGLEVVIAPHPRANYADKPDLFGGRRMFGGKTPLLLRDCALAVVSYSTAVGLGALFGKPMLIYSAASIQRHPRLVGVVEAVGRDVGRALTHIDTDAPLDLSDALTVDRPAYAGYLERYVRSRHSPDETFPDTLLRLADSLKTRAG